MRMNIAAGLGGAVGASADDIDEAFVKKFALESSCGGAVADDFAINGGGWPIRVRGVEGVIAVVVVSGLKQEDDHAVVAETIRQVIEEGH